MKIQSVKPDHCVLPHDDIHYSLREHCDGNELDNFSNFSVVIEQISLRLQVFYAFEVNVGCFLEKKMEKGCVDRRAILIILLTTPG